MKKKEIVELRPEFDFNGMTMIEWFEIHEGLGWCTIKSGLNHADGETKSPYYYLDMQGGINATEKCINNFNNWWELKQATKKYNL